jgi:Short C-terminal domain
MRRRMGRPGLMGTMARTAVIAGTASAVSGGVQRRSAERYATKQDAAAAQQQAMTDQAAAQAAAQLQAQAPPPAAAPPAPSGTEDRIAKIRELGELKEAGLLTDAEFEAEKARVLGG